MVSLMENNANTPDPSEAHEALAEIESAERAVRDVPWPLWLYLVNAVLLGSMALTLLLGEQRFWALIAVAGATIAVNSLASRLLDIPWAVPTSRVFTTALLVTAVLLVGAVVITSFTDAAWPVIACAIGAAVVYLIGCAFHHRKATR